ncbi:hypothetical protein BKA67DRAFT_538861 [Truncatella angustata]|uniref:Uncharacterized protein n=1 Tax=Truncatella angustata TaxID=152316 RepID=A0A9P8UFD0_9PEZI|nr:uncharacterized protein BKA67DRAFT_538861 [Truncatella angustata]KAH6648850.1 hypothetical protein BKA67DRAFT_538861 [Truncatella angustata]KAH8198783.1 hypothetical protein TruAng_007058 [Truncatella angustata]
MITSLVRRGPCVLLPFNKKSLLLTIILLPSVLMWLYHLVPAIRSGLFQPITSALSPPSDPTIAAEHRVPPIDLAAYPYSQQSNLSVNLVIATIASEDISWTSRLQIPNLNIVRYVSDEPTAQYHPPVPKGREALMYHTYLHDFYDALPDVSIFVHADEQPWHTDAELWDSMLFTLSNLDLAAVAERGYANLRVNWYQACPDWINTTKSVEESVKQEEPWMAAAFRANFGDEAEVPEILAGPCCSQFAVTREAIRSRPREAYAQTQRWLVETDWSDYIVGRIWERLWSYLFLEGRPTDCPVEWKAFCRMYGVCFPGPGAAGLDDFRALWAERKGLVGRRGFWRELWDPQRAGHERARIGVLDRELDARLRDAMERGRSEKAAGGALQGGKQQQQTLGDLFVDDTP